MNKFSILIVEDNSITAKALQFDIKEAGYEVSCVYTVQEALSYIQNHHFDILITDINLNHETITGIDIVKKLNLIRQTPVIYLSAYGDDETLQEIAQTNHSYYLSKPYDSQELIKLIKLISYKYKGNNIDRIYLNKDIIFDKNNRVLIVKDKEIKLTQKENLFLTLMLYRKNQLVSIDDLIEFVWNNEEVSKSNMRQFISRAREKLDVLEIQTYHGHGYKLKI